MLRNATSLTTMCALAVALCGVSGETVGRPEARVVAPPAISTVARMAHLGPAQRGQQAPGKDAVVYLAGPRATVYHSRNCAMLAGSQRMPVNFNSLGSEYTECSTCKPRSVLTTTRLQQVPEPAAKTYTTTAQKSGAAAQSIELYTSLLSPHHYHRDPSCSLLVKKGTRVNKVMLASLPPSLVECPKCLKPKDMKTLASLLVGADQLKDARVILDRCMKLKDGPGKCAELDATVATRLRTQMLKSFDGIPIADLPSQRALLTEMRTLRVGGAELDARLAQLSSREDGLRNTAKSYLNELHSTMPVPPIPAELQPYLTYLPELQALRQQHSIHLAVQNAKDGLAGSDYDRVASLTQPWLQAEEIQPLLEEIKTTVAGTMKMSATGSAALPDVKRVESQLARLAVLESIVGADWLRDLANRTRADAASVLSTHLGKVRPFDSVAAARVLQDRFPVITTGDAFPWQRLGLAVPRVSLRLHTDPSASCQDYISDMIREAVSKGLPYNASFSEGEQDLVVALRDLDCSVTDDTVDAKQVSSTRLAGYQQNVNPEYVTLQTRLQAAEADLVRIRTDNARNPPSNGWLAAAQGIAEGLAAGTVTSLRQGLARTAPFVDVPMMAPYLFMETTVERTVRISVSLEITDRRTQFVEGQNVSFVHAVRAVGRSGVLDGDQSGRRNTEPILAVPQELYSQSVALGSDQAKSVIGTLGARAFLARAERAAQSKATAAEVVGHALFARDFGGDAALQSSSTLAIGQLQEANIDVLWRQNVSPTRVSVPKRSGVGSNKPTVTATTPRAEGSRAAIIQRVLRSVVTVQTNTGSGSGFFVSSDGYLLTNAHVVTGADKIVVRTHSGESFLAQTVRCVDAKDIALLKVVASDLAPLEIGDSNLVDVGADVMAVGSPVGLTGTVTRGIVSARRKWSGMTLLQIDAAINPGNSGGPLLSEDGRVVGINTMKLGAAKLEGLGFAIGIADAMLEFSRYLRVP